MPWRPRYRKPARKFVRSSKPSYRKKRNSRYKAAWKRKQYGDGSPFPLKKFTTLKYTWTGIGTQEFTTGSGSTVNANRSFRLNSCYDPYYSAGGTQPRYFDTLCGLDNGIAPYSQYRVHAAKIKVTFNNGNSAGNSNGYVGLRVRDSAISPLGTSNTLDTVAEWKEIPFMKSVDIGSSGGSSQRRQLRYFVKIGKYYGLKNIQDDPEFSATYGADPNKVLLADIYYTVPVPVVGTNYALNTVVEIKYYVEFFNRNLPYPS